MGLRKGMSLSGVPKSKADKVCQLLDPCGPRISPWELESVWLCALAAHLTALSCEIGAMLQFRVTMADQCFHILNVE